MDDESAFARNLLLRSKTRDLRLHSLPPDSEYFPAVGMAAGVSVDDSLIVF